MNNDIFFNLVYEDDLSYCVMEKLLLEANHAFRINRSFSKNGRGYIKNNINGFNNAAREYPWFILVDLDSDECAPQLKEKWLSAPEHPNFIFRVAVREVESWLLADLENLASFLGVSRTRIPCDVEILSDPKRTLINVARRSRQRAIIEDIVPHEGSTAQQGRNYNTRMCRFVIDHWDIENACQHSDSLRKAFERLKIFDPR